MTPLNFFKSAENKIAFKAAIVIHLINKLGQKSHTSHMIIQNAEKSRELFQNFCFWERLNAYTFLRDK